MTKNKLPADVWRGQDHRYRTLPLSAHGREPGRHELHIACEVFIVSSGTIDLASPNCNHDEELLVAVCGGRNPVSLTNRLLFCQIQFEVLS